MKQKHVLILDDEDTTCKAVSRVLRIENFNVSCINNGKEGLDFILEKKDSDDKVDILVTDIQMPKLNGIELIKKLDEEKIDIPVVVITAHYEKKIFNDMLKSNNIVFLEKPFGSLDLLRRIKDLLESREAVN